MRGKPFAARRDRDPVFAAGFTAAGKGGQRRREREGEDQKQAEQYADGLREVFLQVRSSCSLKSGHYITDVRKKKDKKQC